MADLPVQTYDAARNIVFVSHPDPVVLDNEQKFHAYYDAIVEFWRKSCGGKKAWYVVDWNNFTAMMTHNKVYAAGVKRVADECAITIVRFGNDPLQRSAGHLVALKIHKPSHIYGSREEALEVIRQLGAGTMTHEPAKIAG